MFAGKQILLAAFGGLSLVAQAQEAEEAEGAGLDFLEYLGSWQENDEEWLVVEEWDPATDGQPEVERKDEDE